MKKTNLIILIIGLIVLVLFITNPKPEQHKSAVKDLFINYLRNNTPAPNSGFEAMGNAMAIMTIENMVQRDVQIKNYYLFSLTYFWSEGISRNVGIGILGNVYISTNPEYEHLLN